MPILKYSPNIRLERLRNIIKISNQKERNVRVFENKLLGDIWTWGWNHNEQSGQDETVRNTISHVWRKKNVKNEMKLPTLGEQDKMHQKHDQ
jgi:hypothetical protein